MRMSLRLIVALVLACDLLFVVAYLGAYAVGTHRLDRFVDLNGEANVPAWYSSMQWLVCAGVFGVFALRNVEWGIIRSWPLLLVPALFLAMSVDEVAQIHESIGTHSDAILPGGDRANTILPVTGIWMFIVGIPVIVFLLVLSAAIRSYFEHARGAWRKLWLGMTIMLAGALGLESLSNFLVEGSALAILETAAEELMEMVGATIVLWSGLELLAAHGFEVQLGAATSQPAMRRPELRIARVVPSRLRAAS